MVVTTEQHPKTTFRPDVQVEPSEEVPDNSESITSVDTRKVEHEFAVRNVTELIVHDGQQADESRKTRLNDVDGLIRSMRSADDVQKIESSAKTNDPELPEESGCRANSKGIDPQWVAGCACAPSVREASQRACSVEDEKLQRCVDTR